VDLDEITTWWRNGRHSGAHVKGVVTFYTSSIRSWSASIRSSLHAELRSTADGILHRCEKRLGIHAA
jgi:hypothetical protein